jgi:hypothetical protein
MRFCLTQPVNFGSDAYYRRWQWRSTTHLVRSTSDQSVGNLDLVPLTKSCEDQTPTMCTSATFCVGNFPSSHLDLFIHSPAIILTMAMHMISYGPITGDAWKTPPLLLVTPEGGCMEDATATASHTRGRSRQLECLTNLDVF